MKKTFLNLLSLIFSTTVFAQCLNGVTPEGKPCPNVIQIAVPFLRLVPDARTGAMGDVGIPLSPDANSILYNASKLAFAGKKWGSSVNYTPWLRLLNKDIYLLHTAGYYKFGRNQKQAIGIGFTYFDLGKVEITDFNAKPIGVYNPFETVTSLSYSRQFGEKWALGLTAKYITSDLVPDNAPFLNNPQDSLNFAVGKSLAFDISSTYKKSFSAFGKENEIIVGIALSNLGNPITYLRTASYIPSNMGIGVSWAIVFNNNNELLIAAEANKLLVPTPQPIDTFADEVGRISYIQSIFKSFRDAPRGFEEEMEEITRAVGLEYWFKQHIVLRTGYFYEAGTKGGRQYWTFGGGLRFKSVGINLSYLKSKRKSYLDNTWRVSLLLNDIALKN